jgi:hypothetical protein
MSALGPDKALIFRITHIDNVPWILDHGLHCRNSPTFDPNHRNIGNPELIERRHHRTVPIPPGGVLSDYVPFYFTPSSIMLFNIKTGWGGVQQVPQREIVICVSSLRTLAERGIPFVFTDRHAYLEAASSPARSMTSATSTGKSFQPATSKLTSTTPAKRNATRPRPSCIDTCRSTRSPESAATAKSRRRFCARNWRDVG